MSIKIKEETLNKIKEAFSDAPIESGGMIGFRDNVMVDFCFDNGGDSEKYIPNVEMLNKKIEEWAKNGISFAGIVHSHHNDCRALSGTDIDYARNILQSCKMKSVCFPIVTYCGGEIIVTPYKVSLNKVENESLLVINNEKRR